MALEKIKNLEVDFTKDVENDSEVGNEKFKKGQTRFELELERPPLFSDMIWKNHVIGDFHYPRLKACGCGFLMIIILAVFTLFSCFSSFEVALVRYMQTPIGVDCTTFYRMDDSTLE